jgi:hypothetical protein
VSWIRRVLGNSATSDDPAAHAVSVRARYTEALMASAAVRSVGLGQDTDGNPVIVVGVAGSDAPATTLPRTLEGVPVVVQPVGTFTTRERPAAPRGGRADSAGD